MNGNEILPFDVALDEARGHAPRLHVLLGNGFSIACRPDCFSYGALLDQTMFDAAHGDVRAVFDLLGTADFERVIELLRLSAALVGHYADADPGIARMLLEDAAMVREALASALAARHPDLPTDLRPVEYASVRAFLGNFDRIYTMNYDMLLYWAVMQDGDEVVSRNDGFTAPDDHDAPYVVWEPYRDFKSQRLFYLHGGLHLYDTGSEISKITWVRTGVPLVEQIRAALATGRYPLIVTEGSSRDKESKILHNAYLTHALRSLVKIGNVLFIFGHALAENDAHILNRIVDGSTTHLYVSLYGDPTSRSNHEIIQRAQALAERRPPGRPLTVRFYQAESASVWEPHAVVA